MKYPIGIQTFEKIIEDSFVYVDKTDMVYSLAKEGTVYFLSRPRRFGKSLLISTLEAYFLGKKELFKGLKMEALEKDWKVYPVIRIDFNGDNFTSEGALEGALNDIVSKLEKQYGVKATEGISIGRRFQNLIASIHQQTGMRVVVLVDEYDKPLLDVMDTPYKVNYQGKEISLEEYNRNALKSFYSCFKSSDEHLRFVFLTGVTKFSQVSVFSGFNQPEDITMATDYETICGISESEMEQYFPQQIERMADENGCSFDEMKCQLKKQYDGYHFSKKMTEVYNPFSLLNALKKRDIRNYWFQTGTPTYLIRLMEHFGENLDELTGKYYAEQDFSDYKADVERPLPMIYQSGYLTIKDYDPRTRTFKLDIPNDEVTQGFLSLLANNYFKTPTTAEAMIFSSIRLLDNGELEPFRQELTAFFASIPYPMRRNKDEHDCERDFHYTFYLILRLLSTYTIYTEKQMSQGRADCIVETDKFVYIFEFKLNGTADEALHQIDDRGYAKPYAADKRTLYKIGCSFSSETGTIEDWKVAE